MIQFRDWNNKLITDLGFATKRSMWKMLERRYRTLSNNAIAFFETFIGNILRDCDLE